MAKKSKDGRWIDVTMTLRPGMAGWPGDPRFKMKRRKSIASGSSCNLSELSMGSHAGTHMDAPLHFLKDGRGLDQMPLDAVIGPARIIHIHDRRSIKAGEIRDRGIRRGERVIFKTANSSRLRKHGGFVKDFVYISEEAARLLARTGVRTIGIDYLSVGAFGGGEAVHRIILNAGIWIIEGLDLSGVKEGRYDMICLPLRIKDSDGAPARAVLRRSGVARKARG